MRNICVFCGSGNGKNPKFLEAAQAFGESLAHRKLGLIYGGSGRGLMGQVARASLAKGGKVVGVVPTFLKDKEPPMAGLTDLIEVSSMHQRKAKMADLSDSFVALPGGFGTMDELFEILTWRQLGLHSKPIGLLNVDGFFDPLIEFMMTQVSEGLVQAEHFRMIQTNSDIVQLLTELERTNP